MDSYRTPMDSNGFQWIPIRVHWNSTDNLSVKFKKSINSLLKEQTMVAVLILGLKQLYSTYTCNVYMTTVKIQYIYIIRGPTMTQM